jgi:predicted RNA-binding protein with PIN domain
MKKNYIIDGYNLGFKIAAIAEWIRNGDTEKAIYLVENYIRNRLVNKAGRIIVVFDGKKRTLSLNSKRSDIQVIFSTKPETADDVIRQFLRSTKKVKDWIVVSSDNEIRYTAEDLGAQALSSEFFIEKYSQTAKNDFPVNHKKYNAENVDVDYWLKKFNQSGHD